jgi:uncharacterized ion transporter superfamily protein YfcC
MKLVTFKAPNTYFIIFSLIIVVAAFTWIIPGGVYDREVIDGRETLVADSFQYVASNPQHPGDILMAPIRGFVDAALIIGFVLLVGGTFGVLQRTRAVEAAIKAIARAHSRSAAVRLLLIPILMTLFSLMGGIFGFSEEVIPFILIFVPLALLLGYDSITGVAIPFVGAGAGFAGAFFNPFTVGIAQGIAELPLFSGLEYRIIIWLITTTICTAFVMMYAARIKRHPEKSVTYEKDQAKRAKLDLEEIDNFAGMTRQHKLVLTIFALSILSLIVGVLQFHWYIEEIAALFVFTGIVVGAVGRLKIDEIADSFTSGAKALVATAIIIGLARGILMVAKDGLIIDTMLHSLSEMIRGLHPVLSAQAMFIVQTFINFFVPSGSGQAALTMPIMAPLSDLVGVSRQIAVLAYQLGDGFSNMIIPTSAVTMGVLTLADIPWEKWALWILPLEIILFLVGFLMLIPPFLIGWS